MQKNFVSMTWTPGTDPEDAQTLIRTVEDIYALLRRHLGIPGQFDPLPTVRVFGAWTLPSVPEGAAYSNIEWYIKRSLDDKHEGILASRYLETVRLEPWQATSPHFDLAMTDLRITDDLAGLPGQPEALGMNCPGLISLISAQPLHSITSVDLRRVALRHVCAHYFGRLMDIPRRSRSSDVLAHGPELYCASNCAMRFTDTATLALSFGQQEIASGLIYCEACQKDMLAQITGFYYGLN